MKPVCRLEPRPNEWSMLENTQLACPLNANQHAVPAFTLAGPGEHLTGWKRSSPPPPSVFLLSSFPSPLGVSQLCLSLFTLGLLNHQHDQLLKVQYYLKACVPRVPVSVLGETVHEESATEGKPRSSAQSLSRVWVTFSQQKSLLCFLIPVARFFFDAQVFCEQLASVPDTAPVHHYPCQN